MSHRYRRNGIYWLAYYRNGKLFRQSLKTQDLPTAKHLQNKIDKELLTGKFINFNPNQPCDNLLDLYLSSQESRRTRVVNLDCRRRITRFLSSARIQTINQITPERLTQHLNQRLAGSGNNPPASFHEANNIIKNVKAWLNWCVNMNRIPANPVSSIPRYRIPEKDIRFLSKQEIFVILNASQNKDLYCNGDPYLFPVIATAIFTGMRKRELFTLTWQDVDFTRSEIKVRNKDGFTTKSKRNREIPLHNRLCAILKPLRHEKGPCFDLSNNRRVFNRICRAAGITGIGWHTFRHTFASQLIMAGAPLATVSKWLGHSSINTTMIYQHLSRDHEQEEMKKLKI